MSRGKRIAQHGLGGTEYISSIVSSVTDICDLRDVVICTLSALLASAAFRITSQGLIQITFGSAVTARPCRPVPSPVPQNVVLHIWRHIDTVLDVQYLHYMYISLISIVTDHISFSQHFKQKVMVRQGSTANVHTKF
jgi:hypothetical protein